MVVLAVMLMAAVVALMVATVVVTVMVLGLAVTAVCFAGTWLPLGDDGGGGGCADGDAVTTADTSQ